MIGAFGLLLLLAGAALCGYAIAIPPVAPGTNTINLGVAVQHIGIAVLGAATGASGWMLMLGATILGRMKRDAKAVNERLDAIGRILEQRR